MLSITVRLFFMWGNITQLGAKGSDIGLLLLKADINVHVWHRCSLQNKLDSPKKCWLMRDVRKRGAMAPLPLTIKWQWD